MAQSASHSKLWIPFSFFFSAAAILAGGCDKGLGPIYEETGFEGVIHYTNWPPANQVWELRLLVFESVPADSSSLVQLLLSAIQNPGHIVLFPALGTPGLPKLVDSSPYKLTTSGSTLQVRRYNYIVLAWRYGPNSFADWQPAGIYTYDQNTFEPAPVIVRNRRLLENIDIFVDFTRLPPKPWQ
ncbi:MAG: hypothetical protein H6Q30_1671 [Bacteroidetes bacterium]|nr:hypothetical protein [Bacteroidota bacterium]